MANKKKAATTVVAVATAAALLLGGTFAWQSISQTALNEASDVINPGGRLHDDFNGSDKNVYVENFAEDEIFARVRFDEYFEIVMNHGTAAEKTEKITPTATKTDVDTYVTHIFGEENTTDEFWNWTMGSADSEPAYYMPTFNLNKDSLAADVNGVFNGANFTITDKDGTQYVDTYVEWTDGATKEGYEIYDGDTNNVDELSRDHGVLKELTTAVNDIIDTGDASTYYNADNLMLTDAKEEHTAAQVNAETGFMSMQEWIDGGSQKGPYWVYDTDGWCYWAQPIPGKNNAAGEPNTTGLLMDGIALDEVMDDTWYYAINVVGQFITADDIGEEGNPDNPGFMQDGMTPEAEALLEAIGVDVDGTGGGSGGEGEYEYTQETMDELDVRTASMDVYRGTQYTIAYVYDGDVDSAYLHSVDMSSADGNHLSEVHCDGDEVVITVHPEEPNDTLTLTYTFDYDYSYEVEMTLTVLGDIGGEGEGYLEPTDTLPVISITYDVDAEKNTASATVYRGEIYDFAGFQYGGTDVGNVKGETFMLSGAVEPESYVGLDEYNNPLLVIEANEPNDTLTLTGTVHMDNDIPFVITLTVLDSEGGGDDWMPEFTEDPNAAIGGFDKATKFDLDATEYANCLFFSAGTLANEGPAPENIQIWIFDENGTPLTPKESDRQVDGNQVKAYAIAPVPEGTEQGDMFTGVATWTLDGATYGISQAYYWVD